MRKKIGKNNKGVSEIVGTILLLGMAIALFVGVHIVALNLIPFSPNAPSVRISGEIDTLTNTIYLQHNGGDPLSLDTKIIFSNYDTGETIEEYKISDYIKTNIDKEWNIGEIISFTNVDFNGVEIQMIIIDIETNSILAQDIFQG